MEMKLRHQLSIVYPFVDHAYAAEPQVIGDILGADLQHHNLVYADQVRDSRQIDTGRQSMTAEQVQRAVIIKQMIG